MFPKLSILKHSIAVCKEHVVDDDTTFLVQQHNFGGKNASKTKFTIESAPAGESLDKKSGMWDKADSKTLMSVEAKYISVKEEHVFRDAAGQSLLTLYHDKMSVIWRLDIPGTENATTAVITPRPSLFKDRLDVQVHNAEDGATVALRVEGQDIWKQRVNVYLGDVVVMTVKRTDKVAAYLMSRTLSWVVDVAAGMDVALASAIVVVLSETLYSSSVMSATWK